MASACPFEKEKPISVEHSRLLMLLPEFENQQLPNGSFLISGDLGVMVHTIMESELAIQERVLRFQSHFYAASPGITDLVTVALRLPAGSNA